MARPVDNIGDPHALAHKPFRESEPEPPVRADQPAGASQRNKPVDDVEVFSTLPSRLIVHVS